MDSKHHIIDLRSDTVTAPSAGMRAAMAQAEVGDDVYGEDPTVKRLEARLAERLGKEAALFCPSGTQSNLVALLTHCGRGDEYIAGDNYHSYRYEAGGAAVLGGIQPQPLPLQADRSIALADIENAIKADDIHLAKTRLLSLENTCGGYALPLDYLAAATGLARRQGLATHLDGARLFNAALALGVAVETLAAPFDSLSVCLSKGLGAPVGSLLVGERAFIDEALRWRKMTGGGMRQAGMLAAAGLYALDHNVERLAEDHRNAALLAELLAGIDGVQIEGERAHSNMVHLRLDPAFDGLVEYAAARGLKLSGRYGIRLVTHLDVDEADCRRAAAIMRAGLDRVR